MKKRHTKNTDNPKVAIIFDTNALFTASKFYPVARLFSDLKSKFENSIDFTFFVPDVVIRELKYRARMQLCEKLPQIRSKARKLSLISNEIIIKEEYRELHKQIKNISDISDKIIESHEANLEKIKDKIDARYDKWVEDYNIDTRLTPPNDINIQSVIQKSADRQGVFKPIRRLIKDEVVEVGEKGFRDYMIQKTIKSILSTETKKNQKVLVICNDDILRNELKDESKKLPESRKIEIMTSHQDTVFSSLKALRYGLNSKELDKIKILANEYFFRDGDKTCLWESEVKSDLEAKYGEKLSSLTPFDPYLQGILFSMNWAQEGSIAFHISKPEYDGHSKKEYHWISRIIATRKYSKEPIYISPVNLAAITESSSLIDEVPREVVLPYTQDQDFAGTLPSLVSGTDTSDLLPQTESSSPSVEASPSSETGVKALTPITFPPLDIEGERKTLFSSSIFQINWSVIISENDELSEPKISEIIHVRDNEE